MADSIGGSGFPRTGIQEGHLHFDKDNNILYVYNGGDTADSANWSEVGGSGGSGSFERWTYHFRGTEMSVGFGQGAQAVLSARVAGTVVNWGIITGLTLAQATVVSLIYDPHGSFTLVDTVTIPALSGGNTKLERVVSRAMNAGDLITVVTDFEFNPAIHNALLDGFVDFIPS